MYELILMIISNKIKDEDILDFLFLPTMKKYDKNNFIKILKGEIIKNLIFFILWSLSIPIMIKSEMYPFYSILFLIPLLKRMLFLSLSELNSKEIVKIMCILIFFFMILGLGNVKLSDNMINFFHLI